MLPPFSETKRYDMRWRFDFLNGTIKYGKWSAPSKDPRLQACYNNGPGLIRAAIEGKDVETGKACILAECDGWDFINFQWDAECRSPGDFRGIARTVHILTGMRLITRDYEIAALPWGEIRRTVRSEASKRIQLATFGR